MEAKTLRARARANLAGNWGVSIAIAVVASLLGGLITGSLFLPDLKAELTTWFPFLQKIADSLNRGPKSAMSRYPSGAVFSALLHLSSAVYSRLAMQTSC